MDTALTQDSITGLSILNWIPKPAGGKLILWTTIFQVLLPNEEKMNNEETLTLKEAQAIVDQWIKEYGVRYYSELTNTAILMEEVGEFARLMARTYGDQSFKDKDKESTIEQEMGDILFVLICLANQMNISLEESLVSTLTKNTARDKDRHKNNPKLQ